MLSVQCVPDLCPGVNLRGLVQVEEEKKVFLKGCIHIEYVLFVSEVYPEGEEVCLKNKKNI